MAMNLNRTLSVILFLGLLSWQSCSSGDENQEQLITLTTSLGNIKLVLYDDTPKHKASFIELAEAGAYDSTTFYRILKDFMVQGGDVAINADFEKESHRLIPSEILPDHIHKRGMIGAARQPVNRNPSRLSSSQFYIVQGRTFSQKELTTDISQLNSALSRYLYNGDNQELIDEFKVLQDSGRSDELQERVLELREEIEESLNMDFENIEISQAQIEAYTTIGGAPHLDGGYTVFGQVVEGIEIVDKIANLAVDSVDNPLEPVYMNVTIEYVPKDSISAWYGIIYPKITPDKEKI
jgi:peptidyl-prolyl cis-trans isomerase B (cyclophilin B)